MEHDLWGRRIDCADIEKQPQTQKRPQPLDDDYLDVDLLCAKLEAAKREREEREAASRLRKQVRHQVRTDSNVSKESERPHLSKRSSANDGSKRASWYKLPNKFRQSYSTVNVLIPEHEREQPFDLISPVIDHGVFDQEDQDIVLLSRGSTPDEDDERRRHQIKTKRSSFTVLKHFTSSDREHLWRIGNAEKDRPEEKKRSHTVPFFRSRYLSSKLSLAPAKKDSCRPSDVDDSLGGFVNEYTVSFDTCHVKETIRHQAQAPARPTAAPVQRPKLGSNEGMRSLLNLSSMLKRDRKDRTQAQVEEIHLPLYHDHDYDYDYDDDDDIMARRPHTRSQTAPEEIICDGATRLQKAEKVKKRKSVGSFLQTLLLPNHSMSMHQVAI